ncbi:MAG TPA: hypothetical protein VHJ20_22160 [Polyangia bacterium]|nr:hypothetical protein [Polyangia bacterium]
MIARSLLSALFGFAAALVVGCGELPPPPAATVAKARIGPDDSDAWSLVPAAASALVDLNLAALRASAWSQSLVTGGFAEDREERLRTFGYDVFTDVDRLVVAGLDVEGQSQQVVVVLGRIDAARVAHAFTAAAPDAKEARWRDCPIWEAPGRAVALVGRALVHGTSETVRAAIDAAWGVVPSARAGALGELARAVDAEARPPAVTLAVLVTDELRARADGTLELPGSLRRAAARLDLGADLELDAQALFSDGGAAATAAESWRASLRDLTANRFVRVMGFGPVVGGVALQAEGARVHGRLRLTEDKREAISDRFLALMKALAAARAQGAAPAAP